MYEVIVTILVEMLLVMHFKSQLKSAKEGFIVKEKQWHFTAVKLQSRLLIQLTSSSLFKWTVKDYMQEKQTKSTSFRGSSNPPKTQPRGLNWDLLLLGTTVGKYNDFMDLKKMIQI